MNSYDYTQARASCKEFGLQWFGDDYAERQIGSTAKANGFTQQQVDIAFHLHLYQVQQLFKPSNYTWQTRLALSFYFLTGWRPNARKSK